MFHSHKRREKKLDQSPIQLGPRCEAMDKMSYLTKNGAKEALKRMKQAAIPASHIRDLQIFRCILCGHFHLGKNSSKLPRDAHRQYHAGEVDPDPQPFGPLGVI